MHRTSRHRIVLDVNGLSHVLEVEARTTLAEALREHIGLTGTKIGCNRAECGTCTVVMGGKAVYSCTVLAVEAVGEEIRTVEGLAEGGALHPLQRLFMEHDAVQCGYCTPGMLMSAKAMLDSKEKNNEGVTAEDVRNAISGNYCRCGTYPNVEKAILEYCEKRPKGTVP